MIKKISLIIFNSIVFLIFLNLIIIIAWPIYSKYKPRNHNYTSKVIDLLDLNNEDLNILNKETWHNYSKFKFLPFVGHTEKSREGKFVNFTEENGRQVIRPEKCSINIYMYGGSTTFGYNVTDQQTISQYLQNNLGENYCIYNHGRAYYYSKQENALFFNHLEREKKIDVAIFLDGVNERCGSYEYANFLNNSFALLVERPYFMWKKSFKNLFYALPISQFANLLFGKSRWINDPDNNILEVSSCKNKIPINFLFQTRVEVRSGVCFIKKIKCLSLLQPFSGIHGIQIEALLEKERKENLKKKYKELSKVKDLIIDISYILNQNTNLSYVDGVHYSPKSNELIALEISKLLNI